ncbi:MAG TPA: patatin-like phospholipase family protein, partial [Abditibacterium sp.]|jgi:NTE family protein
MTPKIDVLSPTTPIKPDAVRRSAGPKPGIALCLSGGGYRAMLFHLGALWRLNELGLLPKISRVSSVSGGSIIAGLLGLRWNELDLHASGRATPADWNHLMVAPIRALSSHTLDVGSTLGGVLGPGQVGDWIAGAYNKHLFDGATLQDLPDKPRFVINATNVQSGALWRFMKPYMRDYKVGEVKNPDIELAIAVAASSAFPPFLSPVVLDLEPSQFTPGSGTLGDEFRNEVVLTDGGVYDNLGVETVWKNFKTVLVSDGGGQIEPNAHPKLDWARHTADVLSWTDNQVRSLREQQVVDSFQTGARQGAFWGIRTNLSHFKLPDALPCPHEQTLQLAKTATRLKRLDATHQERLINWGYAVCDAAMRRYCKAQLPEPVPVAAFPYPGAAV